MRNDHLLGGQLLLLTRRFPDRQLYLLLALMGLAAVRVTAAKLLDPCDAVTKWAPNADGGNPPSVDVYAEGHTGACLRLRYADQGRRWGNLRRAIQIPRTATGVTFWLRVLHADPGAAMFVWLFEADGDGYLAPVTVDGKPVASMGAGWVQVQLPLSAFRFQPRGNGKRSFLTLDHLLLGCNYANLDVLIDDLAFVEKETAAMPLPRTPDLRLERTSQTSVAVLAEPTFERRSAHSDPRRLAQLLRQSGRFQVTLLRAGDVADPKVLTKRNFEALVIPCAPFYPAAGREALRQFLKEGGAFFSTGGYAFDALRNLTEGGWTESDPAVTAADMDHQSAPTPGLNTRFGQHGDTMKLSPEQLGVFDPSYLLTNVVALQAADGQSLIAADWTAPASLEGFAAVGLLGSNSPVFPKAYSRWQPLVEAVDASGRSRGPVGALVHNFAGPYAGASWAFFGVTNEDLFDGRYPQLDQLFVATVDRLCHPTYLHSFATDLACYREGEPVKLSVQATAAAGVAAEVRFDSDDELLGVVPVADDRSTPVSLEWPEGSLQGDLVTVTATLDVAGAAVDRVETAFVVWNEGVVRSGPSLSLAENYLRFRDVPTFLFGTNETGMVWYSAFENPLTWDRDFRKMNDCGVNLLRVLHFSPFARGTEATGPGTALDLRNHPLDTVRKTDALVQLAQKHNVVLFLTLHDWLPVELTEQELAAQRDWAKFWAERYRDVPGILYDIQNEPSVRPPNRADLQQLAQTWLAQRYGSAAAAQERWTQSGAAAELDLSDAARRGKNWHDLRACDVDRFRTSLFDRWTKANVEGVRAGDPDALVTVGHLQHLTACDKLLGAANLDFTNTHFYGDIPTYRRVLKMIDRRGEGKSFSLGEFGARDAHNARTHGALGDPAEKSIPYFLALGHYALGMGASFIANWDWKEMPDAVFPWGINHQDLVSKPVLKAYRNLALLFRWAQPRCALPTVCVVAPDGHRFGPRSNEVHTALLQAIDWLLDCNVPFTVTNESALERLPTEARTLVWPLPYCPGDDAFQQVASFVERGGRLLFTGDIRFDSNRQPTRGSRLAALGLEADFPPLDPFDGGNSQRSRQPQWSANNRVCWLPYPLELDANGPGAEEYARFLDAVGAPRLRVMPSGSRVQAFEVPLHNGAALIAYNDGRQRLNVTVAGAAFGEVTFELDPGRTGMLMVDASGSVVLAEAQGVVRYGGDAILTGHGHAAVASLDGRDVRDSEALLVAPFGAGKLVLTRRASAALAAELGEFRDGSWVTLGEQPLDTRGGLAVTIGPSTALELRLVASPAARDSAALALARLLSRR